MLLGIDLWLDLFKILAQVVPDFTKLFLVGDFNTRFGSVVSRAVGPLRPSPQNKVGAFVHKWMLENDFFLPATFPSMQSSSDHATFTHSSGSLHRIDFVCLHNSASRVKCGVIEAPSSHLGDHEGILVNFQLGIESSVRSSPSTYDPYKIGC